MRRLVICALLFGVVFAGCRLGGKRYADSSYGYDYIPEDPTKVCSQVYQYDAYEGKYDRSKNKPLLLICWLTKAGDPVQFSDDKRGVLHEINEHKISLSLAKKAVYALQPDYTLVEIPLTDEEVDHVFQSAPVEAVEPTDSDLKAEVKVWKTKILPKLKLVK